MGLEARCSVEWRSRKQMAALHLDSQHLDVRIKPSLRIAFSSVRSLAVEADRLILTLDQGELVLHLGADAERWAKKIRSPRSRLEKLGIKPGSSVCLLGVADADFDAELAGAGVEVTRKLVPGVGLVFLFASAPAALDKLESVVKSIAPAAAVWVLREKGKAAKVSEDAVRKRAKQAGLVDVKVLAFSEAWSGLKLVIPVAKRRARVS